MSSRYAAWIRIGGSVERRRAKTLLKAIREAWVRRDWGDAPFEPAKPDDLLDAGEDGWLWLCDEEAKYGAFDGIERVCRDLGLSYRRHTEAWCSEDAVLVDWRPGMAEPLVRTGSNDNSDVVLVPEDTVREALAALEAGITASRYRVDRPVQAEHLSQVVRPEPRR